MSLRFGSSYITPFIGIPKVFVQLLNNAFDFLYKERVNASELCLYSLEMVPS